MAYKDVRDFISALEKEGEVQRIDKEVDWDLEVGAIMMRSYNLKAPAPFFQKIKGYPEGFRIFGAPVGPSGKPNRLLARIALALGLSPGIGAAEIVEQYIKLSKRGLIKPVLVSSGPCQEEVHIGKDADVLKLPVPYLHENDGGRYLGTWHTVITRDPDTGWTNWGMYRVMVHDSHTLAIFFHSPKASHGALHYNKYEARGEPMPFAIAIGTEPVSALISCMRIEVNINEVDVIGGLRGEPIELVKCQTVDLEVPATAEIVIEGEYLPHDRRREGPFSEAPGYFAMASAGDRPIGRIKAITHRHNPILTVSTPGLPPNDSHVVNTVVRSSRILDYIRSQGVPARMAFYHPESSPRLLCVSTKVPMANYATHVASIIWGAHSGRDRPAFLMVFDDDVDVTDREQVFWAWATRCHPERNIHKLGNLPSSSMDPCLTPQERASGTGGASVVFDCTWPVDWSKEDVPVTASFDRLWPKRVQEKVLKNWKSYGYE